MQDAAESFSRLTGLFSIVTTPFEKDGAFDLPGLAANIERVIGLGFDGILIGGTYGEFPTMTVEERAHLFRYAMEVAGNRVPVMLCSAGSDTRVVRDLTALAGDLGGLPMVTPPFVSEVTNEQIVAFFADMAKRSKTGILIYNAPGVGITLQPQLLKTLAGIEGIVGVKQGDLAPTAIDIASNELRERLRLFCASDLGFFGPLSIGFDGLSSTNSCAIPELILASYSALDRGDLKIAAELHRIWYPLRALVRALGQPQTTKAAMNVRGFAGGSVRLPLLDLNAEARAKVEEAMTVIMEQWKAVSARLAA